MDVAYRNTKTVLLADTMSYGGSERTVQILANNQHNDKQEFVIVSLANVFSYPLNKTVKKKVLYKKNFHPLIKLILLPYTLIKLASLLSKINYSTIISFHQQSHFLNVILSKFLGHKAIVSERSYIELYYGNKNFFMMPIINVLYNSANLIVVNDIEIKLSLMSYYKIKTPITTINNLLDTSNFKDFLIKYKFKTNSVNFITVGRLSLEKNTRDIIIAFAKANIKNATLDIIGDGPLRKELNLLCVELKVNNRVNFHGHQSNVGDFLNKADVFLFSSKNEGFPNAVLEAMFFGLPIISYQFKAGITSILDSGNYGILIPLDDVDKLSESITLLGVNPDLRKKFSLLSRERIKNYTNKKKYINQFYELINDKYKE